MASRLEIEGGKFPVTPQLLFGLAVGFATFNQMLLVLLSVALSREDRLDQAGLFAAISAVLGIVVFVSAFLWQASHGWLRRTDAATFAVAGMFAAIDLYFLFHSNQIRAGEAGLASSVILGAWQARGLIRKWIAGKFNFPRK